MNEKQYIKLTNFFRKTKLREYTVKYICKLMPTTVVLLYISSIIFLFFTHNKKIVLFTLIPATNFLFVTFIRKILNMPRPYDLFNHRPLIDFKKGKGKSFPSRHTSSAFIIAFAYFYLNFNIGVFMLLLAILIGLSRIFSGVHFPRDIIAAIIISIIWGYLGFYL